MSTENKEDLRISAKNLRILRKHLDLTQDELADKLNLSQGTVSGIERGISNMTDEHHERIGDVLGVNLNWLIRGVDEMFLPTKAELEELESLDKLIDKEMTELEKLVSSHTIEIRDLRLEIERLKSS